MMPRSIRVLAVGLGLAACSVVLPAIHNERSASPASPAAWPHLGLTGRLLFLDARPSGASSGSTPELASLDLSSGALTTIFRPPDNGWIESVLASPDGKSLALTYAPPAPDRPEAGASSLYLMPSDGSRAPQPILILTDEREVLATAGWSPDGRALYFAHYAADPVSNDYSYRIDRLELPGGQPQVVVRDAYWPQLSPDGTRLVYVTYQPSANVFDLYLANADGSGRHKIALPSNISAVDAPVFSPDGQTVYFSAVSYGLTAAHGGWIDWLGAPAASAHSVPSDWWRVPADGGQAERLTHLGATGLRGAFSPDGSHLAFICSEGVFVMAADGTSLEALSRDVNAFGSILWTRG
jgi:Tol biopolymer transport system component